MLLHGQHLRSRSTCEAGHLRGRKQYPRRKQHHLRSRQHLRNRNHKGIARAGSRRNNTPHTPQKWINTPRHHRNDAAASHATTLYERGTTSGAVYSGVVPWTGQVKSQDPRLLKRGNESFQSIDTCERRKGVGPLRILIDRPGPAVRSEEIPARDSHAWIESGPRRRCALCAPTVIAVSKR